MTILLIIIQDIQKTMLMSPLLTPKTNKIPLNDQNNKGIRATTTPKKINPMLFIISVIYH